MGLTLTIIIALLAFAATVFSRILAEEFKAWRPTIVSKLIDIAVGMLPTSERERYVEEFASHAEQIPGDLGKLLAGFSFITAAIRMSERPVISLGFKRAVDIAGSSMGLLTMLPILFLIVVIIKLESKGPIFVRRSRTGLNEALFEILMFRTMYIESRGEESGSQMYHNDPRVTRFGRILQKTSLDELPQLWNVLVGDMSIVGPRAHAPNMEAAGIWYPDLVENYGDRHLMRPGITGLAQSRGLRGPTYNREMAIRRVASDVEYIANFSLLLDTKIIMRTLINEYKGGF